MKRFAYFFAVTSKKFHIQEPDISRFEEHSSEPAPGVHDSCESFFAISGIPLNL